MSNRDEGSIPDKNCTGFLEPWQNKEPKQGQRRSFFFPFLEKGRKEGSKKEKPIVGGEI